MFRNILVFSLALVVLASCGSKPKVPDVAPPVTGETTGDTSQDATIANKELTFDATGSDSGKISGLYTVNFEYDKASLNEDSKKKLADNAQWIKSRPGTVVQVEGHCDEKGSIEYNLALGERRAKAAKAYLVGLGVGGKQLSVISYGKEKPLDKGDSESAMSKNRRANFVPLTK